MKDSAETTLRDQKYWCFISYRHGDNQTPGRQWATWLHQAIETYEIPLDLIGTVNDRGDTIPERIFPVFRDETSLPVDADLATPIYRALDASKFLVVICSPRAVESTYVGAEIRYFKQLGRGDRVLAVMVAGEPNASWDEGKQKSGFSPENECFPDPLRHEVDPEGNLLPARTEPIAADFRLPDGAEEGWTTPEAYRQALAAEGRVSRRTIDEKIRRYRERSELMKLKIIAGILGLPLDHLTQRDKAYQLALARKRQRITLWVASALGVLALAAAGASLYAFTKKKDETKARKIAEEQKGIAITQKKLADQNARDAEKARSVADAKRIEAENLAKKVQRGLYQSQIGSANQLMEQNRIHEARRILFSTTPTLRDWEWGLLMQLCGPSKQDLTDFVTQKQEDRPELINSLLGEAGAGSQPKQSRNKDWVFESTSPTAALIAHWGNGSTAGAFAEIRRSNPDAVLFSFRTEPDGKIEGISFSHDDSIAYVRVAYGRITFAVVSDGIPDGFSETVTTKHDAGTIAVSLPDQFDLSKGLPAGTRLVDAHITFSQSHSFVIKIVIPGPKYGDRKWIEFNFAKASIGFHSPAKTVTNHPNEGSNLEWLNDDIDLPTDSKKLWVAKFRPVEDGLSRGLGSPFDMNGRQCVTVSKSDGTVEIWSIDEAKLLSSFGKPANGRDFGLFEFAADVSLSSGRIFACPVDVTPEGVGAGAVYDLNTHERLCVLLDAKGEPIRLGGDPSAWLDMTAQLDPKGEFVAIRKTGRNEEGFGIWSAKTGRPIVLRGDFIDQDQEDDPNQGDETNRTTGGEGNIPGVADISGISWTPDGRQIVIVNRQGEVFLKSHLLDGDTHKLAGANLSVALEDRAQQYDGHWSPVRFPARFLSDGRLLAGNYVIDTKTWTVLLELPMEAEIAADNSLVATWTGASKLELCDMSFWRAYHESSTEGLRLREQLLLWQVGESDKAASSGPH